MLTVIESPTYLRSIAGIWSEDEAAEFVNFIAANPDAGDVMAGTGGLRKVRWNRSGMGKRGGARAIYVGATNKGMFCCSWPTPRPSSTACRLNSLSA